jgi:hypothetical protein
MRTANLLFFIAFAAAAALANGAPAGATSEPAPDDASAPPRRFVLDDPIEISGVRPEPGVQFVSGGVEDARRALESLLADGRTSATGALVSRPEDVPPIVGVHAHLFGSGLDGDPDVTRALALLRPELTRCHVDAARTATPVERVIRVRFFVDVNGTATRAKAEGAIDRTDPFVACVERATSAQPWPKALAAQRALTLAVVAGALPPPSTPKRPEPSASPARRAR